MRRMLAAAFLALSLLAVGCADDSPATSSAASTTTANSGPATESTLAPTPSATADVGDPTPQQTEGPYFKSGSPERNSLVEEGTAAERLVVSGRVLDEEGNALPRATLEFWQADENGVYDLEGYRYRGHQLAGADGAYRLETVVPGLYAGRTRHVHVKVTAADWTELTTQLYLPDEPQNERDGIFDPRLLLHDVTRGGGTRTGAFDFVLPGG